MGGNQKRKGIVAWLVTWEHIGDHAKPTREVEAFFNPHWSADRVIVLVEFIYASKEYSLAEQISIAKSRKNNPYPATRTERGHITCGHNPWLHARLVDNLRVETTASGKDKVTWDERPEPKHSGS